MQSALLIYSLYLICYLQKLGGKETKSLALYCKPKIHINWKSY